MCEDAVYHRQCSSNFQTGKGNPKKSVMPRKCGRNTTVDNESVPRNRWTNRFSFRSKVWYYNSGKNDGRKIEW